MSLKKVTNSLGYSAIKKEDFAPLLRSTIESYRQKIKDIKDLNTYDWQNAIAPLEEAAENLDQIWNKLEHLNSVANTKPLREIYETLLPEITEFHSAIMQDEDLFNIYNHLANSQYFSNLSLAQQNIIKNKIRDFKLSGINLNQEQKLKYRALVQNLSMAENKFANNVLDSTEAWNYVILPNQDYLLQGLPEYTVKQAKTKADAEHQDAWILTLDQPCYYAVLANAKSRKLRQIFYEAYNTKASDQGPTAGKFDNTGIIAEILSMRAEISKLLGYNNFAEYSLVSKMADNLQIVNEFLLNLVAAAKPKAEREIQNLCEFAKSLDQIEKLEAWDVTYYSELYKKLNFDIDEEKLRTYFPEPRVLTGLFKLVRKLYNIDIEEISLFTTWHESVRMFKVVDNDNKVRGYFYIDLYTRDGKRGGAWMADCQSRMHFANGVLQAPVAFLNCNFTPPQKHKPGLLTHDEVITLFHEFGHTLHHILTQVDYYSAAGMNGVAWDAVELPSQFMENWCWEWSVIQDISEHIESGESLPYADFEKLLATKNYLSAMGLIRQLEFALFDLRVHDNIKGSAQDWAQRVLNEVRIDVSVLPVPKFNRFQNSFLHIFSGGYAAGYYSYLWAEVLSCDAFEKFVESGLFNPEISKKFLINILEQGGSRPAMDLYIAFAGHKPQVQALLKHHAIIE